MIEIIDAEPTLWDKIRMIAEYYSKDSQSKKLLEEMVELAVEINFGLFENGGNLPDNTWSEVADVIIMCAQITMQHDKEDKVREWINYKVDRQLRRMRGREKESGVAAGSYEPVYRGEIDVEGQMNLEEWQQSINHKVYAGCTGCICRNCLYWWSKRCPYGECWDDHRAVVDPYDKAHPDQPPRTAWSNWNKPGEQAHWCRGGTTYPIHYCKSFVKYNGQQVKTCLKANVSVFQDGYISCGIIDSVGCERCYEEFEMNQ